MRDGVTHNICTLKDDLQPYAGTTSARVGIPWYVLQDIQLFGGSNDIRILGRPQETDATAGTTSVADVQNWQVSIQVRCLSGTTLRSASQTTRMPSLAPLFPREE